MLKQTNFINMSGVRIESNVEGKKKNVMEELEMVSYDSSLVFGKRVLLGQVVLEPRIVPAIVVYHVISPNPFETPPLRPCRRAVILIVRAVCTALHPVKTRVAIPGGGINFVDLE
ncbi:hypothetical protein BT93_K2161 [Corymbia citriodora subsp. variegata]|nr:hypothetical protein BT93_K2161 [Corymbia citriodora subsp. variegata]